MDYPALVASISGIDRRVIYLVIALSIMVPLLLASYARVEPEIETVSFYERIQDLSEGDIILLSVDYMPGSASELEPMITAFLKQVFSKDIKIVAISLNAQGTGLLESSIENVAAEYGKNYGDDWVFLGYRPSSPAVIISLSGSPHSLFPEDPRGNELSDLPLTKDLNGFEDFNAIVAIASGASAQDWVIYGYERYTGPILVGLSGGIGPAFQSFYDTHHVKGIIAGLQGAAEYEQLVGIRGEALRAVFAQSVAHLVFVGLIVVGNLSFLAALWIERAMR